MHKDLPRRTTVEDKDTIGEEVVFFALSDLFVRFRLIEHFITNPPIFPIDTFRRQPQGLRNRSRQRRVLELWPTFTKLSPLLGDEGKSPYTK